MSRTDDDGQIRAPSTMNFVLAPRRRTKRHSNRAFVSFDGCRPRIDFADFRAECRASSRPVRHSPPRCRPRTTILKILDGRKRIRVRRMRMRSQPCWTPKVPIRQPVRRPAQKQNTHADRSRQTQRPLAGPTFPIGVIRKPVSSIHSIGIPYLDTTPMRQVSY